MKIEGDGIRRLERAVKKLGKSGKTEIKRGLISGGRKVTPKVKSALVRQTSIKKRSVDRQVTDRATDDAWIITVRGGGVPIREVQKVSGRKLRKRNPRNQPRDASGRFANWPRKLGAGVTATVWGGSRTFFQSYKDDRGFRSIRSGGEHQTIYGPSPAKEAIKDQSADAFNQGARLIQTEVEGRLITLSGKILSK